MGQKTHPYGFRLGITKPWRSRWFAKRDYARLLHEDLKLKRDLLKQLSHAGVSNIEVERMANKLRITIFTSRPGIIIGRKGSEIDKLKADIQKRTNREVYINIQEIHRPELDAQLVAGAIAMQLEKRIAFRRAMRCTPSESTAVTTAGSPSGTAATARATPRMSTSIRAVRPRTSSIMTIVAIMTTAMATTISPSSFPVRFNSL